MDFKEWEATAKVEYSCPFGHSSLRDVYRFPNGTVVYHEQYIPRMWSKTPSESVTVELSVQDSKDMRDLAAKYKGQLEQTPYGNEGVMMFVFDNLRDAYAFSMNERENLI